VGEEDLAVLPSTRGASESECEDSEEGGGLLVELDQEQAGVRSSVKALAQQWFAQDAFAVRCHTLLCFWYCEQWLHLCVHIRLLSGSADGD
jgi:hypothetical protein